MISESRFNWGHPEGLGHHENKPPTGKMFPPPPEAGGGSGPSTDHPFKVYDASSGTTAKIGVIFGQVNSVTPTMGGGATPLDDPTPPTLNVTSGVIYLHVSFDVDGLVTGVAVGNTGSLPSDTALSGYITLAVIVVDGTTHTVPSIFQSVRHSLAGRRVGVSDMHFWAV